MVEFDEAMSEDEKIVAISKMISKSHEKKMTTRILRRKLLKIGHDLLY
jgi:hypothetical protein